MPIVVTFANHIDRQDDFVQYVAASHSFRSFLGPLGVESLPLLDENGDPLTVEDSPLQAVEADGTEAVVMSWSTML